MKNIKSMKRRNDALFSGLYFFYFAGQSCLISYLNVYLEKYLHFTGRQLGLFTGISVLSSVVLIPLWGVIGDRTGKYKMLLNIFLAALFVSAAFLFRQSVFLGALVFEIMIEVSRSGILPLSDTQTMNYCAHHNGNYGWFRSMGSLGWVVSSVVLGGLATGLGLDRVLPVAYLTVLACCIFMAVQLPTVPIAKPARKESGSQKGWILRLFHNRSYVFLMLITMAISGVTDPMVSYIGNYLVTAMGGNESLIGLNTVCSVVPEILYIMIFSSKVLPRLGFRKVYVYSAVALILRMLIYLLAPNPYLFLVGSLFHCFTVCCISAANLALIRHIVPEYSFGTAVTLMTSANTIGRAFFGYVYGWIYGALGGWWIFAFTLAVAVVMLAAEVKTGYLDVELQTSAE